MRIVIESEERAAPNTQPTATVEQADIKAAVLDAGAPSASLIQSLEAIGPLPKPEAVQRESTDAGAPAETLVQAVQDAPRPMAAAASASNFDAGAAPSLG